MCPYAPLLVSRAAYGAVLRGFSVLAPCTKIGRQKREREEGVQRRTTAQQRVAVVQARPHAVAAHVAQSPVALARSHHTYSTLQAPRRAVPTGPRPKVVFPWFAGQNGHSCTPVPSVFP